MIIKLGFVRDGHIVGTKFYGSHEQVMIPIFSAVDIEKINRAFFDKNSGGGPRNLVVFSPQTLKRSVDELKRWIPEGIGDYTSALKPAQNPFHQGQITEGGILVPSEVGLGIKKP